MGGGGIASKFGKLPGRHWRFVVGSWRDGGERILWGVVDPAKECQKAERQHMPRWLAAHRLTRCESKESGTSVSMGRKLIRGDSGRTC